MTRKPATRLSDRERTDLCGEIVDSRYLVECCIGAGGMGIVWRVQHVQTLQRFAMKTLRVDERLGKDALHRMLREARAVAAISSRNVVRLVDVNLTYEHRGEPQPFLVMDYLDGPTFEQVLEARHSISPSELIWLIHQVSQGLMAAHSSGVVHRDLKPSNLILARSDETSYEVKLCDFGLAKLYTGAPGYVEKLHSFTTRAEVVLGTPRYMAPEQVRQSGRITAATDQWALAQLVYRALVGLDYFAGVSNSAQLILAIVHEPLTPPSVKSKCLTRGFDDWFLRSCSRNVTERFQDVAEQCVQLELALGSPHPLPIVAPEARVASIVERHASMGKAAIAPSREPNEMVNGSVARCGPWRSKWLFYLLVSTTTVATLLANWLLFWSDRNRLIVSATQLPAPAEPSHISFKDMPSVSMDNSKAASPETTIAGGKSTRFQASMLTTPSSQTEGQLDVRQNGVVNPRAKQTLSDRRTRKQHPQLLGTGAPCIRSAQCASGLCFAEACQ